jgi:DNA-directed RNA polymerase specialized sigma24 family protein
VGALARLPPRRRAVVVLHEIEGHTLVEVAWMLGIARHRALASRGRWDLQRRSAARGGEDHER